MSFHKNLIIAACAGLLAAPLAAATWVHSTVADFNAGSSDGEVDVVNGSGGEVRLAKLAGTLGAFQSVTPLPLAHVGEASWSYGNRLYIAGGYYYSPAGNTYTANIYSNDLDSSGNFSANWTLQGTLPTIWVSAGPARWMNHLYFGGGFTTVTTTTGSSPVVRMATLDSTGMPSGWQDVTYLPQDDSDGRLIAAQGKLYYLAASGVSAFARSAVYAASILADGTLGPWIATTSRPMVMRLFSENLIGDSIVMVGGEVLGYTGNSNVISTSIDDQGNLSPWVNDFSLPQPRSYLPNTEGDGAGKIFLLGGKTYPPTTTHNNVYSAAVSASGTVGAWSTEASLPANRSNGTWVTLNGKIHYLGGTPDVVTSQGTVYSASLNQGTANAAAGSFSGQFDVGSVISLGDLQWTSNAPSYVQLQVRVGNGSGVFGTWTSLTNSGSISLLQSGRYVEYRAKLTDNGSGNVELDDVTLRDLAAMTPTITPTSSPTPSPSVTLTASPTAPPATSTPTVTATPTAPAGTATPTVTVTPAAPTMTQTPPLSATPSLPAGQPLICPRRHPYADQKIILVPGFSGHGFVRIYRPEGRICSHVWDGDLSAGQTRVLYWNTSDDGGTEVASGIYMVVFQDGNGTQHKAKVAIIR